MVVVHVVSMEVSTLSLLTIFGSPLTLFRSLLTLFRPLLTPFYEASKAGWNSESLTFFFRWCIWYQWKLIRLRGILKA